MKQLFFSPLVFLLLTIGCTNSKKLDSSIDAVTISIEQNGMTILPSNGIHKLDKKEFKVILEFPKPMAVLVNTRFNNDLAAKEKSLARLPAFQEGNTMAVSLFNEEQTIFMSEEASSPWYYENEQDNNFNDIKFHKNRYQCTRTVKYFHHGEAGKTKIENIEAPIFLVFVPSTIHHVNPDSVDMLGKYLKIEWNESKEVSSTNTNMEEQQAEDAIVNAKEAKPEVTPNDPQHDPQYSSLINRVIMQLELDRSYVDSEFVSSSLCPDNSKESIVFIPVVVEEREDFFMLSSYVVIADNETENIIHTHFEPYSIQSDAIYLTDISIDTTAYNLTEDNWAYGIKVSHRSMSQPNPYRTSVLSLYIKSDDDDLTKILNDFTVSEFIGEGDASCQGEFIDQKKVLETSTDKTNGFYDIIVKETNTKILRFEDDHGDCDKEEEVTRLEYVLGFDGEEYRRNGELSGFTN